MPIGLGLACSHVPNLFIPPEDWDRRYRQAIADVPPPIAAAKETPEVQHRLAKRVDAAFDTLRQRLETYRPDVLVMVSDDHGETFDRDLCMPTIAMHTGDSASGHLGLVFGGPEEKPVEVRVKCHREIASALAAGLVRRDFDLAIMSESHVRAMGQPDRGMGHGFTRIAPKVMPALDVPCVLIWLNCYYEPLPRAARCIALGRAIADVLAERPERVAILGTGGLSHDPRGPRGGWIDEPLDRSVLAALADGEPDRLSALFEFQSDTFHGGTGEIRSWLVVGGAMGDTRAEIVDYMPIYHAIAGVGFAAWTK